MPADDRVAVITGAAAGIGRAIAFRLAEEGYFLALGDLPRSRQGLDAVVNEIGPRAKAFNVDVAKEEDVKDLVKEAVDAFGRIDVFVANAGVGSSSSIVDTTVEDWDRSFAINVRGTMLCYKHAAKQMISQGYGGRIVGATSVAGKRGFPNTTAYCSSKFAIRGLTQATACDLGKFGITVNCYAPGLIDTSLLEYVDQANSKAMNLPPGAWREMVVGMTPMGKVGKPEEVAGLVAYIVSPQAEYITGQCITIDGGTHFD